MDKMFTPPPSSMITPDEWQQTLPSVQAWIGELVAEVKQLRETVEQLQEIVNRCSQNSSGSPRKRGGQPGHRGHYQPYEVRMMVFSPGIQTDECHLMHAATQAIPDWPDCSRFDTAPE